MSRTWWGKVFLFVFFLVMAVIYVYPTVTNLDPEKSRFPFKQKVNLGLDLQGGLYLVMGVDFPKVYREVVSRQATSLEKSLKDKGLAPKKVEVRSKGYASNDPRILVQFDPAKREQVYNLVKEDYWTLRLAGEEDGQFLFGLARDYRNDIQERTINQSIEVIRNRIDEFGVTEPSIVSQGEDRVVIELPGVKDVERAKSLIGQTAKLEFKIVADDKMPPAEVAALVDRVQREQNIQYKPTERFSDYAAKINQAVRGQIPEDTEIAFERVGPATEGEAEPNTGTWFPYLLYKQVDVTGEDLQDANVGFDPENNNQPVVTFEMSPKGAQALGKLTEEHTNERMAIVLDNIVHSAPVIQSTITDRGQITLGRGRGDELLQQAKDMAIVLRAGALPAQLELLEQRVVGPTLGQDSIEKGAFAALIGSLIVFFFTLIYYRLSGVIAVTALGLNIIFILAVLVGLEATLTLPGIAGIALTVGMAVDASVIIFERIREEIRAGKKPHGAIEAGFQKALSAILDSNVTTAAAAVVLLIYGTGPIKGFAVTLLIGIVTTLFTAVFISKMVFELYLRKLEDRRAETLSI